MIKTVVKQNGEKQPFDHEKIVKWAEWAGEVGADWGIVLRDTLRMVQDECTTRELHLAMIRACRDKKTIPYEKMAGRLYIGMVYKDCYGDYTAIPTLSEFYTEMVELGYWKDMGYSEEELDYYDGFIDHDLDLNMTYSQAEQIVKKYSAQDRVNGRIFESPQFSSMRMALGLCYNKSEEERRVDVPKYYEKLSVKQTINAPTPNNVNLGTYSNGYASCCGYMSGDSVPSLTAGNVIATVMTAASAGIGSYLATRSPLDPVRGGSIKHLGKKKYFKHDSAATSANTQGSRGGGGTTHMPCIDPEIFWFIKLRNPTTVPEERIPDMDFSAGTHPYLAHKAAMDEEWLLVSRFHAPKFYELYYSDNLNGFIEEYKRLLSSNVPKTVVKARELAMALVKEPFETGRFYEHNTYWMNHHTPFKNVIYHTNLCQEVFLPSEEFSSVSELYRADGDGEIFLCNLAAIVAGRVDSDEEYEESCYYALKMISDVIDIMDYPFPSLEFTAKARRSAGVGITNLAHDLAMKGYNYTSAESKKYIHRQAERHSYFLHKAAIRLTKERGVCLWTKKTKYPDGWLPINTYCEEIDRVVSEPLHYDWEAIRKEIIALGGLHFSVLEAFMPVESSSLRSYTTNGLYPVRGLVVEKKDGNKITTFIAPDSDILADKYQLAHSIPTKDMIDVYAIWQKFCGQGISADEYINTDVEVNGVMKYSGKVAFENWLYRHKMGLKSRYYTNPKSGLTDDESCPGGACKL